MHAYACIVSAHARRHYNASIANMVDETRSLHHPTTYCIHFGSHIGSTYMYVARGAATTLHVVRPSLLRPTNPALVGQCKIIQRPFP